MSLIHFNKLVRDRIPEILHAKGMIAETRVLTTEEYARMLRVKLVEEAGELDRALTSDDLQGEIVDVLEVVDAIAALSGFSRAALLTAQEKKRAERGGFSKRIFLIRTKDAT